MTQIRVGGRLVTCTAIVFDKDGTLTDSYATWARLVEGRVRALAGQGFPVSGRLAYLLMRAMGYNARTGRIDPRSPLAAGTREETVAAAAFVLYRRGIPWDQAVAMVRAAFDEADETLGLASLARVFAGTADKLRELREAGCRIGVATNDSRERTGKILELCGLAGLIDAVACGDEVERAKPAPDLAVLVCQRLGVTPGEALFVGDSLTDAAMARAASVGFSVGVLSGGLSRGELEGAFDAVIGSVLELRPADLL
ncbi:MAG: HAD family hydrolase [Bacillota bacterium]|nr:HAD family hydrolase [Bacillota bacterium]